MDLLGHSYEGAHIVENYLARFNEVWRPVLKNDPYRAEFMKFKIERLMRGGINEKNAIEIRKCIAEIAANTARSDWASNIYIGILYFMLGFRDEAELFVRCNIDYEYETESSRRLLALFEGKSLPEEQNEESTKNFSLSGWLSGLFRHKARVTVTSDEADETMHKVYSELAQKYRKESGFYVQNNETIYL